MKFYDWTLSHIQQICSKRLWKHLAKNMENSHKWMYDYWAISSFVTLFSKVMYCKRIRKSIYEEKGYVAYVLAWLFEEKARYTTRLIKFFVPIHSEFWLSFLYQFIFLSKPLQILLWNLHLLFTIITSINRQEYITLSRFL